MTAATTGGHHHHHHHRRTPSHEDYGVVPDVPPCPPLPPLYPHCMRHQEHRCLYNAQQHQQQVCRRQWPVYQYADGHACQQPGPSPTRATLVRKQQQQQHEGQIVLKVVSEASAEPDKKVNYEIVSENVRHGRFRKAVPRMPLCLSIILCVVNMLAPGVGTFLAGLTVLCGCKTEYDDKCTAFMYNILATVLQLLTALVVVGWVWSIMWGITFVSISIAKRDEDIITAAASL